TLAELGRLAQSPIGTVVVVVLGADARFRIQRQVIEFPYDACRFTSRPRARRELHRSLARTTRACKVCRQLLLVVFDDLVDSGAGPRIDARAGHYLHQVEDLIPAGILEAELQYISRWMTGRAIVH